MLELHTFSLGPIETNAYLLINTATYEAILVDAPSGAVKAILPFLEEKQYKLVALLITHGHYDHIQDAHAIQKRGIATYGHRSDKLMFSMPLIQKIFMNPGWELESVKIDNWIEQGQILHLLGQEIEVRHVPGHCAGNVLFYFPKEKWAFVGDALFAGSVGRTDLPGGSMDVLKKSIQTQIYTLPETTRVFPGHGPETTVGEEARSNPYVRTAK